MRSVLLLLAAVPSVSALDVLVIDDGDSNADDLVAEIESYGHDVALSSDAHDFYSWDFDGGGVDLEDYDAVVLLDGAEAISYNMPRDGRDALSKFVGDGGGFLLFGSTAYHYYYDDYGGMGDLIPLETPYYTTSRTFTCIDGDHPVTDGYSDGATFTPDSGLVIDTSAAFGDTLFTFDRYGTDRAGVVAAEEGDGRLVQYAFFGNTTRSYSSYETEWTDDNVSRLVENGLQWVVQRPPVVEGDALWTVAAESSVTLGVDAAYDPDGGDVDLSWDVGDDGSVESTSTSFSWTASGYDGPTTEDVTLTVTDDEGDTTVIDGRISVSNVAPVITSGPSTPDADEGDDLSLSVSWTDVEAADTHTVSWNMGDGTTLTGATVSHSYADDGRYTVLVTVTDDDGGSASASAVQGIANVAPTITGTPDGSVEEGTTYLFTPGVDDPGTADTHGWLGTVPPGASLDTDSGEILWTPTWRDLGDHDLRLTVSDDDGGSDSLEWTVEVVERDADSDGISDGWEEEYGLDPSDPTDASEDPDGDGRTNLDEWEEGTDPGVYDGPGDPTLLAPDNGAEVDEATPQLQVGNATAPLGQDLTYGFYVYADEALTSLVATVDGRDEGPDGTTEWRVTGALDENTDYWWTASAADDYMTTDKVAPSWRFFVNTVNEAPSAPSPYTPFDGGIVDSLRPDLVLTGSIDVDRDVVTYTVVLTTADGVELARVDGLPDLDGEAAWGLDADLTDETEYCWSAFATDEHGLDSAVSETACFYVDLFNDPPTAPAFLSPTDGGRVSELQPTLTVQDGVDPEGRATIHEFELDSVATFDSAELQTGSQATDDDGETSWTPASPLREDATWYARARCNDGGAASDWVEISFSLSAAAGAPSVPLLVSPAQGAEVEAAPVLVVDNAVDPEDDVVVYDFVLRSRSGSVVAEVTGVSEDGSGQTSWAPGTLDDGVYAWTARAVDEGGDASEWADAWVFAVIDGAIVGADEGGDTGGDGLDPSIKGTGCSCSSAGGSARGGGLALVLFGMVGLLGLRRRR
ncbi:MAG: PKD domain-containing protein [Alphaproteobacteria bacterium]|nr:PKD domain-containing protein [Alphaproteobacteria bacterium]